MNGIHVLQSSRIVKSFGNRTVVSGVDLDVRQGEIVGLLGPNGAGKTTSFYMLVGLIKPDKGDILLDGRVITNIPMHLRGRNGIGYLPQEPSICRRLSVWDNLRIVLEEMPQISRREIDNIIVHLLEEMSISHLSGVKGNALSGGERRRVEIARVLACMPLFLLLDEPFSGIDPIAVYEIQQVILALRNKGYGVLLTDHNVRETLAITDRTYLIHEGRIVIHGKPDEVASSEMARKFYLGERFVF